MSSPQTQPDTPAFTALLDAYTGWQQFEQRSPQATLSLSSVPGHGEHAHLSAPTPAPLVFIMTCPYIDVPGLPEDARNCPICTDPNHRLSDRERDRNVKVAQRLPCGHYLCNYCLYKWPSPFEQSNNNICPFDRRVFFAKVPHFLNTEGIQGRVDLVDWSNEARRRQPVGAERDTIRGLKAMLVERRLGEAIEEVEVDRCKADTLTQSRISAREIGAAVLVACRRELLLLFEHRLTTMRAITDFMEECMRTLALQARLQRVAERLARDRAYVQGIWDAMNALGKGKSQREGRGIGKN